MSVQIFNSTRGGWARRRPKNASDEPAEKRLILDIPTELYDRLEAYCVSRGEAISEVVIAFIEDALKDFEPETNDTENQQQKKQTSDGKPASEGGAADPDNGQDGRRKERPPLPPTPAEAHATAMENKAHYESLVCAGRFQDAADFAKVVAGCAKIEAKANQPSVEQQQKSLVNAIVKAGNQLFANR